MAAFSFSQRFTFQRNPCYSVYAISSDQTQIGGAIHLTLFQTAKSCVQPNQSFHCPQLLKNLDLNKISWQIAARKVAVRLSSILTCLKSLSSVYFPFYF